MADLISRAAAIDHMKTMADCAKCDNYNYVKCRACSWNDAMNIVEELPAVDAAPVVHGRWIASNKYKGYLVCSNCSDVYVDPDWPDEAKWRYCPHCGAKMDGERREPNDGHA